MICMICTMYDMYTVERALALKAERAELRTTVYIKSISYIVKAIHISYNTYRRGRPPKSQGRGPRRASAAGQAAPPPPPLSRYVVSYSQSYSTTNVCYMRRLLCRGALYFILNNLQSILYPSPPLPPFSRYVVYDSKEDYDYAHINEQNQELQSEREYEQRMDMNMKMNFHEYEFTHGGNLFICRISSRGPSYFILVLCPSAAFLLEVP